MVGHLVSREPAARALNPAAPSSQPPPKPLPPKRQRRQLPWHQPILHVPQLLSNARVTQRYCAMSRSIGCSSRESRMTFSSAPRSARKMMNAPASPAFVRLEHASRPSLTRAPSPRQTKQDGTVASSIPVPVRYRKSRDSSRSTVYRAVLIVGSVCK